MRLTKIFGMWSLTSNPGVLSLRENLQNSPLLIPHSCVAFLLGPKQKALKCREKNPFLGVLYAMRNGAVGAIGGESSPCPWVPWLSSSCTLWLLPPGLFYPAQSSGDGARGHLWPILLLLCQEPGRCRNLPRKPRVKGENCERTILRYLAQSSPVSPWSPTAPVSTLQPGECWRKWKGRNQQRK